MGRKASAGSARTEVVRVTAETKAALEELGNGNAELGAQLVLSAYAMGARDTLKAIAQNPAPAPQAKLPAALLRKVVAPAPAPAAPVRTNYIGKRR